MSAQWSKLQEIFDEAWALDPASRSDLIAQRCAGDAELRAEVERMLLAFDEESHAVFQEPQARPNQRFGVWETVELLGRGGMGEVYLARRADGHLEQRAALKVMSPHTATPEYIERFRRERQLLARLEHPNIARLLDAGVNENGAPYMVMEYVEGERLDNYCDGHGLTIRERVHLMQSLCLAVEGAHRNLILHRDIKPSNVLVTAERRVKLLDFGAAREVDGGVMETRAPLTPAYASPEQLRGESVTTLCDVYGLGATLYRLLAGIPPFGTGDRISYALIRSVLEEEPALPSDSPAIAPAVRRELQGDLDNIVRKAMEKDPARRYASAERLSSDLERWLQKRPIEARPRTWRYRAECFVSRNRWGVALAGTLLLTLIAATVAIAWQVSQEREAARDNARLTEFLTRVMGLRYDAESSPMRAHGRATRMIDVIRYAGGRLAAEMKGQPHVQARLDADIGHALAELGYFAEAERSLRQGLQLVDPSRDPVLAGELTGYLARNHFLQGAVRATENEFNDALRLVREGGPTAPHGVEQLLLLNLVPVSELIRGETPGSEGMTERAVELGRQMGEQSPAYALALQARADMELSQGKTGEAERDIHEALRIQESMEALPVEHAQSLGVLAILRAHQKRFEEAMELVRRSESAIEESLGRASLNFQLCRVSEAQLQIRLGDFAAAEKIARGVDAEVARDLPQAKWVRTQALDTLASALTKSGRKEEARAAFQQALALAREDPGPESPLARTTQILLTRLGP